MIYRKPRLDEAAVYEGLSQHPLQSQAWGEFRESTGVRVERLLGFDKAEAEGCMQISFHPIPKLPYTVGYFPKGTIPDESMLAALMELGKRENALFIKLEPDYSYPPSEKESVEQVRDFLLKNGCEEGRPLFTKYSFVIDLQKPEEELMAMLKAKTRYNVRLAQKHGVEIVEDNSEQAFEEYIQLLKETTKRQQFFAHTEKYHRQMWDHMYKAGTARLLKASYQNKTLVVWILFVYKNRLYYPYGASSREHREVMASNLLMWEAIRYGKLKQLKTFDLWGALGPNPDPKDPWYGFHSFKEGYGGELAEFVGSYDLIVNPPLYTMYRIADRWRWRLLKLKSKLPFIN